MFHIQEIQIWIYPETINLLGTDYHKLFSLEHKMERRILNYILSIKVVSLMESVNTFIHLFILFSKER